MASRKTSRRECCTLSPRSAESCSVESLVSVDERGQMVLPKGIREKAGIRPGDKLAVVSWQRDGKVCCISLIKSENLVGMVKDLLGPLVQEIVGKGKTNG